jgi:hypothetical protein
VAVTAYGVGDSRALSYALVLHAVNFLPFVVPGAAMMAAAALRRRRPQAPPPLAAPRR